MAKSLFLICLLYQSTIFIANCDITTPLESASPDSFHVGEHEKDSGYVVVRTERKLDDIDSETSSHELTDEERSTRCLLGSRRQLRKGDAERVATYFINDGPTLGYSHFVRASNPGCDGNNDQMNVVGMSNSGNEKYTQQSTNERNSNIDASNPIYATPYDSSFYIPATAPIVGSPYLQEYRPITGRLRSVPQTRRSNLPFSNSLLGSILHPHLHPLIHGLHRIPHLLRAAAMPAQSLINNWAPLRSPLQHDNIVGSSNTASGRSANCEAADSTKSDDPSPTVGVSQTDKSNMADQTRQNIDNEPETEIPTQQLAPIPLLNYYQPTGYIVRLVPHNRQSLTDSTVGAPQRQSSDCSENSAPVVGASRVNTEKVVENSVNNKNSWKANEDLETMNNDNELSKIGKN